MLQAAADAGAVSVGGIGLHLRGEVREVFFEWLRSYRPDLVPRYEELYRRGAYAPKEERRRLAALVGGGDPAADSHPLGTRFGTSAPAGVVRDGAGARTGREADGPAPAAVRSSAPPPPEVLF